jgi:hypothetical protein
MSLKTELEFKSALLSTALVQPIDSRSRGKTMEILCRQIGGQEKPWLAIVRMLLQQAHNEGFELHVCRRYVLKDGDLAFGWNLGIEAPNVKKLATAVDSLNKVLATAKPVLTSPSRGTGGAVQSFQDVEPPPPQRFSQQPPRRMFGSAKKPVIPPQRNKKAMFNHSRPPNQEAPIDEAPEGFMPTITTVSSGMDQETGKQTLIREMPLPHVYRDLNRPNAKGKGAKLTAG